ncbi:hypothetical protein Pan153_06080 [Gimesia panareensis]|uniref:DUF1501 domain-containing protein n=1 Tax=Gimesia panareensis TaxID=2527978 RepID=A0A518FI14_9PLAN|nr:DUF1501 domain-containing protein [Gimesia panareensis]QDV15989.1 hypothetical protein Pan153_06080 [Gimesia panareensis]
MSHFHRRDFLKLGAFSLTGMSTAALLAHESASRRSVPARNIILVWLAGGPATIDMWDLKRDASSPIRGEFRPISTAAKGIEICEHLPKLAALMQECSLIRSVSHTIAEHGQGTEYVTTGNPISPSLKYPSIGSVVAARLDVNQEVPVYIEMDELNIGQAGYLGSTYNAFHVNTVSNRRDQAATPDPFLLQKGMTVQDLTRRKTLLQSLETGFERFGNQQRARVMNRFQQQAMSILAGGKTRQALDLSEEDSQTQARYGFGLGRSALTARRLIERGARFVTIGLRGWDTHSNNFTQLRETLLPQLDRALSALISDLKNRGLLQETIVYCVGEFGRTPVINSQGGRDHWARAMSILITGGGFRRGFVYGSTEKTGSEPASNACSPADVNATILNQLGIHPDTLLTTRSGRPLQVFRDGHILTGII